MEQLKINAIAHLILDHLSGIRDYFEAAIGTTNNQDMEINMFHAIDDFAAEIYVIIETYKNLVNWQEYRKKLRIPLSMDRKFHPMIYNKAAFCAHCHHAKTETYLISNHY